MDIHTPVAVFPGRQEPMKVDFESDYKCSDNVFNQYRDDVRGETMISFYCIQSDFIEHHLFTMKDMSQVQISRMNYSNSHFLGFDHLHGKSRDILILLSNDLSSSSTPYSLNLFDIQNGLIIWIKKYQFSLKKQDIRDYKPLRKFHQAKYVAVFTEQETEVLFVATSETLSNFNIKLKNKVRDIFMYNQHLYFTHYDQSMITVHKIYPNLNQENVKVSTDWKCDLKLLERYLIADIGEDGTMIIFRGINVIEIYSIRDVCGAQFERTLPLYTHHYNKEFSINLLTGEPIFNRHENYLFVILQQYELSFKRSLFVYDIKTTAHDSLVSKIDLDIVPDEHNNNNIFVERIISSSMIAIYIYYDTNVYEYFEFQPNNFLVNRSPNDLFLPLVKNDSEGYEEKQVNLTIKPFFNHYEASDEHEWLYLSVNVSNRGLIIEQRPEDRFYTFPQNDETLKLSMLDIFDGFDMNYNVLLGDTDPEEVTKVQSQDNITEYILDGVTAKNPVSHAFVYNRSSLFVLYEKEVIEDKSIYKFEIHNLSSSSDVAYVDDYFDLLEG